MKRLAIFLLATDVALALSAPALAQHAGHAMPTPAPAPVAAADPHAGHTMPAAAPAPDPHASHALPHSGPAGTDLPAGESPPPPVPAEHSADAVYGAEAMAMGRHHLEHFHGRPTLYQVMANIAEV